MSLVLYLTNNIGPTSVGVNTFSTIVLLTLITNFDGGTLLTTRHTHTHFHTLLPHLLPHLAWWPTCFGQSQHEAVHAPMVHKGGRLTCPRIQNCIKCNKIRTEWCNSLGPPAFSGDPNKKDKIRSGCLTLAFSGAQKRAEVLGNPCVLGGPQTRGQNQKSKPRGNNDTPSISKNVFLVQPDVQTVAQCALSAPPKRSPVGHGSKKMPGVRPAH